MLLMGHAFTVVTRQQLIFSPVSVCAKAPISQTTLLFVGASQPFAVLYLKFLFAATRQLRTGHESSSAHRHFFRIGLDLLLRGDRSRSWQVARRQGLQVPDG